MQIVKIKTTDYRTVYINTDDISYFYDEKDETYINLKDNRNFVVSGNLSAKLSKVITATHGNGISTLE